MGLLGLSGLVASPASAQSAPDDARRVEIRFASSPERMTLAVEVDHTFLRVGDAQGVATGYETVCVAPCVGTVAPGPHVFAVHMPDGEGFAVPRLPLDLRSGIDLEVRLHSRHRIRLGLALSGIMLLGVGVTTTFWGARRVESGSRGSTLPIGVGATLAMVGVSLSFSAMGLRPYRVETDVRLHPR